MTVPHSKRTSVTHPCVCAFCDRTFHALFALRQHELDVHGLDPPREIRQRDVNRVRRENIARLLFQTEDDYVDPWEDMYP